MTQHLASADLCITLLFFFVTLIQTPLHAAALDNKCVFVSLLLSNGARMDVRDASQEQPLDLAEKNHSAESASMLLAHIGNLYNDEISLPLTLKALN